MRRRGIWLVLIACLLMVGPLGLGRTYVAYHDSTEGHYTALVLTNVAEAATSAEVTAYDSAGERIAAIAVELSGFASAAVFLEELIEEPSGLTWGLVRVETEGRLALASWIGAEGEWLAVENTSVPLTTAELYDYSGYWMTTNYANTPSRTTVLSLVNPYEVTTEGLIYVYDAEGGTQLALPFELAPRTSAVVWLNDELEAASTIWGMIDVSCDVPILLVTEYVDAADNLIDIDTVTSFYLVVP